MKKEMLELIGNTIRGLVLDAVLKANSGHVGLPLGCAEIAAILYSEILNHYPKKPNWINRDRFILSAGHGSMLLYSILHLSGYELSLDDIKNFRQLHSITPGHPEYNLTPGVEVTTGPLGQGVSNAVGIAIAERILAEKFNTDNHKIINHYTYCLAGDGCLMEGVSAEAISLAGHLGLNKLILLYDYNSITIDGPTDISYSDNPSQRFDSYNWHTQEIDIRNGDYTQFKKAIENAKDEVNKPSIIVMKTIAGKGLVNYEGSHKSHGNPMNESDVIESKNKLNINESFFIPDKVKEYFNKKQEDFKSTYESWEAVFDDWKTKNSNLAKEFELCLEMQLDISKSKIFENEQDKPLATRALSGKFINAISDNVPFLVGGSADLAGSTKTTIENSDFISRNNFNARNIHFGVREHAMGGILNGIALHKGLRPYGGTFLVFSDYMRPSIRLASLMKLPVIYIFTHDSFQVGEDGPTHQPIEQISSLRDIPNLIVIRPADSIEIEESWKYILKQKENPVALILTRQKVKPINRKKYIDDIKNIQKGAYIIKDCKGEPDLILIACGSELPLAIEVSDEIEHKYGKKLRVISMISQEIFDSQMDSYKEQVLPPNIRSRVAIETGITDSWKKYVGIDGLAIGINRFGESAPATDLVDYFGFTKAKVIEKISIFFGFK